MSTSPPEDAFMLDIRRDLERIDPVMTQIVRDPVTSNEFIRDPSGVLSRLGLHPPASRQTHDRVNRVFYAVLTNAELMEFVTEVVDSAGLREALSGPMEDNARHHRQALREG